jgi:hypothetical protein
VHYKKFFYTFLFLSIATNSYGHKLTGYNNINNIENEAENLVAEIENNKNDALKKHQKNSYYIDGPKIDLPHATFHLLK